MKLHTNFLKEYSIVILTGGSSGIGICFLKTLFNLNPNLQFCNLSRQKPEINFSNIKLFHQKCDLAKLNDINQCGSNIIKLLKAKNLTGKVLLINNSGFGSYGPFPAPDYEHHIEMIKVNVSAPVHLTALLLPILRISGGSIINIASTAAFQPLPNMATYAATKAFLMHWSLALNEDLSHSNIKTLAVCPGPTTTQFFKRAGFKQSIDKGWKSQTAEDVVNESLQALVKNKSLIVTGARNKLLTIVSSKLPKPLIANIAGKIFKKMGFDNNLR